jgi:hypothetical protein
MWKYKRIYKILISFFLLVSLSVGLTHTVFAGWGCFSCASPGGLCWCYYDPYAKTVTQCKAGCPNQCTAKNGTWSYGPWGACSSTCGTGTETRTASCNASCGGTCGTKGPTSRPCTVPDPNYVLNIKVGDYGYRFIFQNNTIRIVSCRDSSPLGWISGASVSVYKTDDYGNIGDLLGTKITNSSGIASFAAVSTSNKVFLVNARKTSLITDDFYYEMLCPTPQIYKLDFSANPPAACSTQTSTLGLAKEYKKRWEVVMDADVYAAAIEVAVPSHTAVTQGFYPALINSSDRLVGGFVFSKEDSSISSDRLYEPGYGGSALNLSTSQVNHDDRFLSRFSFNPPSKDVVNIESADEIFFRTPKISYGGIRIILPSGVSKITASEFNKLVATGGLCGSQCSFTGSGVLYITGSAGERVEFNTSLYRTGSLGWLIIVTPLDVVITKNVGTAIASYSAIASPNIDAAIITAGNIIIKSSGGTPGTDIPIVLRGPLVAKGSILFQRNLSNNGLIPAELVSPLGGLSVPYYITDISILEKAGLTTYGLDFVYED